MPFSTRTDFGASGAYFRKVTSSQNISFTGIRGEGRLPTPSFDKDRHFVQGQPTARDFEFFRTGPLDRPSVYFGGNCQGKSEMDIGLSWDRVYSEDGLATYTDLEDGFDLGQPDHRFKIVRDPDQPGQQILINETGTQIAAGKHQIRQMILNGEIRPNFAFRPFIRTRSIEWHTPPLIFQGGTERNIYLQPGESFAMEVRVIGLNKLSFRVGPPQLPAERSYAWTFAESHWGTGTPQSFKRVNAIDQFFITRDGQQDVRQGNENKTVIPTHTVLRNGLWTSVELLTTSSPTAMVGESFTEVRGHDLAAKYKQVFEIGATTPEGGESLNIIPFKP